MLVPFAIRQCRQQHDHHLHAIRPALKHRQVRVHVRASWAAVMTSLKRVPATVVTVLVVSTVIGKGL